MEARGTKGVADSQGDVQGTPEYDEGPCVVGAVVEQEESGCRMVRAGAPLGGMLIEKPKQKLEKPTGST